MDSPIFEMTVHHLAIAIGWRLQSGGDRNRVATPARSRLKIDTSDPDECGLLPPTSLIRLACFNRVRIHMQAGALESVPAGSLRHALLQDGQLGDGRQPSHRLTSGRDVDDAFAEEGGWRLQVRQVFQFCGAFSGGEGAHVDARRQRRDCSSCAEGYARTEQDHVLSSAWHNHPPAQGAYTGGPARAGGDGLRNAANVCGETEQGQEPQGGPRVEEEDGHPPRRDCEDVRKRGEYLCLKSL